MARAAAGPRQGHRSRKPKAAPRRRAERPLEYRILLTATFCLLAVGAVMVYSASSAKDLLQGDGNGSAYLTRYVLYGAIGLVVMRVLSRHGLAAVRQATPLLLIAAFGMLVLVLAPGFGVEVNGAKRWLGAGPVQFQPSELMKVALVLYAAQLIAAEPRRVRTVKGMVRPLLLVVGAACLLVFMQPDLGTALVMAFTVTAMLVAAGVPMRTLGRVAGACAVLVLLFALLEPYRRARLTSFINPWADAGGAGFQSVQGQIALGSGGLFGVGLGQSVQKAFYLPEAHTDFILAVIGEELGLIGLAGVLSLYGMIAWAGFRTARAATGAYAKLLATGLTSLILCQASLNVFAVLGLAPLTGVPLPFVSYGGTTLIVLLGTMGLLLNVATGGSVGLRSASAPPGRRARADAAGARGGGRDDVPADRDRRRRDGGTRRAGTRGGRRAAG
jgi:cell division protein FtsW